MPQNDLAEFIGGPRDGDQITLPDGADQIVVALGLSTPQFVPEDELEPATAKIQTGVYAVRRDHGLRARRDDGVILLDWKVPR